MQKIVLIPFLFLMIVSPSQADVSGALTGKDIPRIMTWSTEPNTIKAKKNNLSTHVSKSQQSQSPNALVTHINEYVATRVPEDEYIVARKDAVDGKLGVAILINEVFPYGLSKTETTNIINSKKEELAKNYCELMVDAQYPIQIRYGALTYGIASGRRYDSLGYFEFETNFCHDNPDLWKTGLRKIFNW